MPELYTAALNTLTTRDMLSTEDARLQISMYYKLLKEEINEGLSESEAVNRIKMHFNL